MEPSTPRRILIVAYHWLRRDVPSRVEQLGSQLSHASGGRSVGRDRG
jgi:hypothetical protein